MSAHYYMNMATHDISTNIQTSVVLGNNGCYPEKYTSAESNRQATEQQRGDEIEFIMVPNFVLATDNRKIRGWVWLVNIPKLVGLVRKSGDFGHFRHK